MKKNKIRQYSPEEMYKAMDYLPSTFFKKYELKTSNGVPFEFEAHKFFIAILDDMSPYLCLFKPPQIGATEVLFCKGLWTCKMLQKNTIYTLPKYGDVKDMVGSKFNKIISHNPIFSEWVKEHDTIDQKGVGNFMLYFRSTWEGKATMISSELNIHDEVDASDIKVINEYETRQQGFLANSQGWRWYFSHPSVEGYGVDLYWQKSDKKEWYITCLSCKKEQVLTFPDNIDFNRVKYVCKHCKADLTDKERQDGVWKATVPGKCEISGYHISQMMCTWVSLENILKIYKDALEGGISTEKKDMAYFYNYVLGLPYAGSDNKINESQVLQNCKNTINSQQGSIVIGVDTGSNLHWVIGNQDGIFGYGKTKYASKVYDPYEELDNLLRRYPTAVMVIDANGDHTSTRIFADKWKGRVFICYYNYTDKAGLKIVDWGQGSNFGSVKVDRNAGLDMLIGQLKRGDRLILNGSKEDYSDYASHFTRIVRKVEVVKEKVKFVWTGKPDHYVHATLYFTVGLLKTLNRDIVIMGEDNFLKGVEQASNLHIMEKLDLGELGIDFKEESGYF